MLKKRGYAVARLDEKQIELVKEYRKQSEIFFSKDEKLKFKYSPKLEEVEKKRNIGWISADGKKEFIKLRKGFVQEFPNQFSDSYLSLEKFFIGFLFFFNNENSFFFFFYFLIFLFFYFFLNKKEISESCFDSLAKTVKMNGGRLIEEKLQKQIIEAHRKFSSLASVKYFNFDQKYGKKENSPYTHYPSSIHKDLGIVKILFFYFFFGFFFCFFFIFFLFFFLVLL